MTTINQPQRETWNGDTGHRWVADADRRDAVLAPVADALLAAARIESGESTLDVGCGCGVTTIAAAAQAGPGGTALGIDLSEPMLEVARQRVDGARVSTVTFTQADAQTDDIAGGNDVVISRFGTMFFDDPVAAFTNIGSAVRPGGRLFIATWQPLARNDWLIVPGAALLQYGSLPDDGQPGSPGMFSQADPDLLRSTLTRAGWSAVDSRAVAVTLRLGDEPADATDYLADSGVGRAMLETIPAVDTLAALAAVTNALAPHATDDGVHLDAAILITKAVMGADRGSRQAGLA